MKHKPKTVRHDPLERVRHIRIRAPDFRRKLAGARAFRLSVRLPADVGQFLQNYAMSNNRTMTEVIDEAMFLFKSAATKRRPPDASH
jgi:hypothetical protein